MNHQLRFDLAAAARRSMIQHGFEPDYPPPIQQQLTQLRQHPPAPVSAARDLRKLLWSSIDNDTSRDLDQIEYAEALPDGSRERTPYAVRRKAQDYGLPPLPTTTIGSFPQTTEIRRARRDRASGATTEAGYREFCRGEIARSIRLQQDVGLDVLVHGEPERNDMVQYFAERLDGFACTRHGWVQSYGTRYVRPPLLTATRLL